MSIEGVETTHDNPGEPSGFVCTRCGEREDSRWALRHHECFVTGRAGDEGPEDRLDELNEYQNR